MDKTRAKNFRRLFFDLRATWLASPAPERSPFDGTRDDFSEQSVKPVAWGWTARTLRSSEAAIRLGEAGLSEEATPLLRCAIEHAIFLWWLQDDRGKVIEVLKRAQRESLGRVVAAQSLGWALDVPTLSTIQELVNDATEQHKKLDAFAKTGNLARRYTEDVGNLYQAWLYDTQTSHATLQSAFAYFRTIADTEPDGPGFRLLQTPDAIDNVNARAAIASHAALTGYSRATNLDEYFNPKLDSFAERFKMLMGG